jgi:hypothetical protein
MGLIQKSTLVTLNQRVQGSSPCAPTKFTNDSIYLCRLLTYGRFAGHLYVPAVSPNKPLLYPDETGVERSRSLRADLAYPTPADPWFES